MPYDEPPDGRWSAYAATPAAESLPPGAPFQEQPRYDPRSSDAAPAWRDSGWHSAAPASAAPASAEPTSTEPPRPPRHGQDRVASGQPGWQRDRASGWPDYGPHQAGPGHQQRAWSQDAEQGWPQGTGAQPGWPQQDQEDGAAGPGWSDGQEAWPEEGEALEALPPMGDVHEDWPGRGDRAQRGWIPPEDERDAESW
jgi:hypothetical protein